MTLIHYKFPHIEQLKNVLVSLKHKYQNPVQTSDGWVFDETLSLPIIEFYGTVKLHGSNTAIVVDLNDSKMYAQSRESILTPESDYKGFAKFVQDNDAYIVNMVPISLQAEALEKNENIVIYGEWCGQGIQSGVGISDLPRMFVIFAVKVGNRWCAPAEFMDIELPDSKIFNIFRADPYNIVIDFNVLNEQGPSGKVLFELASLTEEVEKECPFAKSFGVSGVGEGIVWRSLCDARTKDFCGGDEGDPWLFKVKGEKHKNVKESKLITLAPEITDNINQLLNTVLTEQRLEQGIEKLGEKGLEVSKKNTSHFMKWIGDDIKRECRDILETLTPAQEALLSHSVMKQAREWFFKQPGV